MKAYVFLYSRTAEKDYRPITVFDSSICPTTFLIKAEKRARGLLRADDLQLEQPQWLFMKEGDIALWGVACMNRILNKNYSEDRTGTPIRVFISFVVPHYHGEPLPHSINAFTYPFQAIMGRVFNGFDSSVSTVFVDIPVDGQVVNPSSFKGVLNTDVRYCKLFPCYEDGLGLLSSAIGYDGDISIAINVANEICINEKRHSPPMNAVLRERLSDGIIEAGEDPPVNPREIGDEIDSGSSIQDEDTEEQSTTKRSSLGNWIRIILLILSMLSATVLTYYLANKPDMFKRPTKERGTNQQIQHNTQTKVNSNNSSYHNHHGIPQQNSGVHEGTNEVLSDRVPKGTESRVTAPATDSVFNPKRDSGNVRIQHSLDFQSGSAQP